ncbi:norphogenetic protein [Candidatus Pantoea alvi]|uniref:hypothetical protein n=1 Tax=Pantoea septica TaxID=472695 RepID=UPI000CDD388E|nr:hypothetical protein [Pantoea septica]POW54661.1 norphogenetic protein [Pantoea alvi]
MFPFDNSGRGDRCIIVASGPSAYGFKAPKGVPIIAVNGAIDWIDRASFFFTLDQSAINKRRMAAGRRRRGVQYCCAEKDVSEIHKREGVWYFNRVSERGDEPEPARSPEWWVWRWSAKYGLCENKNEIANGNSAWGALNLAHHIGFKHVALVGVDATREPRAYSGGRPNELCHLPLLFQSARDQIDVVSCGKMGGIPQMTLKEWLKNT